MHATAKFFFFLECPPGEANALQPLFYGHMRSLAFHSLSFSHVGGLQMTQARVSLQAPSQNHAIRQIYLSHTSK